MRRKSRVSRVEWRRSHRMPLSTLMSPADMTIRLRALVRLPSSSWATVTPKVWAVRRGRQRPRSRTELGTGEPRPPAGRLGRVPHDHIYWHWSQGLTGPGMLLFTVIAALTTSSPVTSRPAGAPRSFSRSSTTSCGNWAWRRCRHAVPAFLDDHPAQARAMRVPARTPAGACDRHRHRGPPETPLLRRRLCRPGVPKSLAPGRRCRPSARWPSPASPRGCRLARPWRRRRRPVPTGRRWRLARLPFQ